MFRRWNRSNLCFSIVHTQKFSWFIFGKSYLKIIWKISKHNKRKSEKNKLQIHESHWVKTKKFNFTINKINAETAFLNDSKTHICHILHVTYVCTLTIYSNEHTVWLYMYTSHCNDTTQSNSCTLLYNYMSYSLT